MALAATELAIAAPLGFDRWESNQTGHRPGGKYFAQNRRAASAAGVAKPVIDAAIRSKTHEMAAWRVAAGISWGLLPEMKRLKRSVTVSI